MALNELLKEREIQNSTDGLTGKRAFTIDGCVSPATLPLAQLIEAHWLGKSWDDGGSRADATPLLRVSNHHIAWISDEQAIGIVNYSSNHNNDITFSWDLGVSYLSVGGFDNNRIAQIHFPCLTFIYERTECIDGFWNNGVLVPWSTATSGWGEESMGAVNSQRKIAESLTGKTNSDAFLGDSSNTWLFLGASARKLGTIYWKVVYSISTPYEMFRVTYSFSRKPHATNWRWMHPDTGDLEVVYPDGTFQQMGLIWPLTGNSLVVT